VPPTLLFASDLEPERKAALVDHLCEPALGVLARLPLDVDVQRNARLEQPQLLGLALVKQLPRGPLLLQRLRKLGLGSEYIYIYIYTHTHIYI
jgi:hypothetical protein